MGHKIRSMLRIIAGASAGFLVGGPMGALMGASVGGIASIDDGPENNRKNTNKGSNVKTESRRHNNHPSISQSSFDHNPQSPSRLVLDDEPLSSSLWDHKLLDRSRPLGPPPGAGSALAPTYLSGPHGETLYTTREHGLLTDIQGHKYRINHHSGRSERVRQW